MKEILPQAVRVAILSNTKHQPGSAPAVRLVEDTAHALDMLRRAYDAGDADELRAVFSRLDRRECDALFLIGDHSLVQNRMIIINAAADLGIPLICAEPLVVADGGFMCLGRNRPEIYRRLAYYVDTILKGTPPGDLPIEEPSKSTLVFNLKTAKALGITIPGPILMRADHLIE